MICLKNATKGNGLKFICDFLNVSMEKTFAIGDSGNDISMFQKAGFSVAMENSLQEVKDVADAVTLSNEEDGIVLLWQQRNLFLKQPNFASRAFRVCYAQSSAA